jgi:hypothetical protein
MTLLVSEAARNPGSSDLDEFVHLLSLGRDTATRMMTGSPTSGEAPPAHRITSACAVQVEAGRRGTSCCSPRTYEQPGTHCCVAVGAWPCECAALSKSCVGAHSRADSRADRRSSNLVTLPADVVTATDVIECDQSAISAPVMVFHEEPETAGTTAFLSGAEGIRTPDPLTASHEKPIAAGP